MQVFHEKNASKPNLNIWFILYIIQYECNLFFQLCALFLTLKLYLLKSARTELKSLCLDDYKHFKRKRTCFVYVGTSDLSIDTKKHMCKSREAILFSRFAYGFEICHNILFGNRQNQFPQYHWDCGSRLFCWRFPLICTFSINNMYVMFTYLSFLPWFPFKGNENQ
jgi:hypothetical protein